MTNVPAQITRFLEENFPPKDEWAGYVVMIVKNDMTYALLHTYESEEARDKIASKLADEMDRWPAGSPPHHKFAS